MRSANAKARDDLEGLIASSIGPLEAFVRMRAGTLVRERESVHDLVQSVCREALVDLPKVEYRDDRQFMNWLFLIATRKILDRAKFYRRERRDVARERPLAASEDVDRLLACYSRIATPSRIVSAREELSRIEHAIAALPPAQREAVAYVKVLGIPYTLVAERLSRSESAVRALVARALATIAERLD